MTVAVRSPEVTRALEELEHAFPCQVRVEAEDASGAIVHIVGVELGSEWTPSTGDLWFMIPFHYPDAAIYPYYVTGATRTGASPQALQTVQWRGMAASQVSLRHNRWNPRVDTALGSVRQTLAWLQTH